MRVIGIDPGSINTGWGIIEFNSKNKVSRVDSGTIKLGKDKNLFNKLNKLSQELSTIIQTHLPAAVVMESLIFAKNPSSLFKLSQTRGAILLTCAQLGFNDIFEYSPNQIKKVVSGYGHADKDSMKKFVSMLVNYSDFSTHDESDALAIAICHFFNYDSIRINSHNRGQVSL